MFQPVADNLNSQNAIVVVFAILWCVFSRFNDGLADSLCCISTSNKLRSSSNAICTMDKESRSKCSSHVEMSQMPHRGLARGLLERDGSGAVQETGTTDETDRDPAIGTLAVEGMTLILGTAEDRKILCSSRCKTIE